MISALITVASLSSLQPELWSGINLRFNDGKFFVLASVNGEPGQFILDTGSPSTYISREYFDRLSPETRVGEDVDLFFAFKFGEQVVLPTKANISDPWWTPSGEVSDCDGVLGWDTLKNTVVELASPYSVLWIPPTPTSSFSCLSQIGVEGERLKEVKLANSSGKVGPYVSIRDIHTSHTWSALFDTGSFGTIMPASYTPDKLTGTRHKTWFMGQWVQTILLDSNSLEITDLKMPLHTVSVCLEPIDGSEPILGLYQFLMNFGIIMVGGQNRMYLSPIVRKGNPGNSLFTTSLPDPRIKTEGLYTLADVANRRRDHWEWTQISSTMISNKTNIEKSVSPDEKAVLGPRGVVLIVPKTYNLRFNKKGILISALPDE